MGVFIYTLSPCFGCSLLFMPASDPNLKNFRRGKDHNAMVRPSPPGFQTSNGSPVMSSGLGRPRSFSIVGAMSARRPPSRILCEPGPM